MSNGGKRREKRSHRPGWQPPNRPETWDGARDVQGRSRSWGHLLGHDEKGSGGKGVEHSVTRTPGSQAPRRRRLSVIRGGMPAGACPPWAPGAAGNLGSTEEWLLALGEEYTDPAAGPEVNR